MTMWGVLMQMDSGETTVSGLVFENQDSAVLHSEELQQCAGVVSVEVMSYSVVKG